MTPGRTMVAVAAYAALTASAWATDVAFWHEYKKADARTYLLLQFNDEALKQAEGPVKSVEAV